MERAVLGADIYEVWREDERCFVRMTDFRGAYRGLVYFGTFSQCCGFIQFLADVYNNSF